MIIGGFAAGVRILLENGPSRDHILKIRKIPEKYHEIICNIPIFWRKKNLAHEIIPSFMHSFIFVILLFERMSFQILFCI
jgi:hypothetical protein